jgi:hypothetical protein
MTLHSHLINCANYRAIARRKDRTWGHAIDVEVFHLSGEKLGSLTFACQPEFEEFEYYQKMTTEELLSVVTTRLESAIVTSMQAWISGLHTFIRFNGMVAPQPSVQEGLPKSAAAP